MGAVMFDPETRASYREVLKAELTSRCRINPRYSLRAFARDTGLAPSRLSEIFSGKQGLSRDVASKLADRLGYTSDEKSTFCDLVESEHARSKLVRKSAAERVERWWSEREMLRIKNETFHLISDWHHLAILELMGTKDFRDDPAWIARRLGIGAAEVALALERLEKFGFICRQGEKWILVEQKTTTPGGVPSETIKKFHHQMIQKAADAVWLQQTSERELSTVVIAIDSRRLPEARQMIQDFWRNFCTKMEVTSTVSDSHASNVKDSVYCLAVQFFGLAGGGTHESQ